MPETQISEANEPSSSHEDKPTSSQGSSFAPQHIDLFADHEEKQKKVKPMDEEKRLEQEKYEKQIGYLTYLGQDTHESLGTRSWYNVARKRDSNSSHNENGEEIEVGIKVKHLHDPMLQFLKKPIIVDKSKMSDKSNSTNIQSIEIPEKPMILEKPSKSRKRSATPEKKHKKSKRTKKSKDKKSKHKKEKRKRRKSSSESGDESSDNEAEKIRQLKQQNLQKLREERIQREKNEQNRTKEFLRQTCPSLLPPEEIKKPEEKKAEPRMPQMKQKYNSQFNPYLAKQNYSN